MQQIIMQLWDGSHPSAATLRCHMSMLALVAGRGVRGALAELQREYMRKKETNRKTISSGSGSDSGYSLQSYKTSMGIAQTVTE